MSNFIEMRFVELVITCIAFCLSLLFFTIVSEDYGSFAMNMAAGQFCDFSLIDYYYLALIGLTPILKLLYRCISEYNWMGAAYLLFEMIALYLILISVRKSISDESQNLLLTRVIQVLIALLYIDSFLMLYHTRSSMLLCGISLFKLAFIRNLRKIDIFWFSLIFILGMLIRPESSIGMLLFVSAGYFIYNPNLVHLIKRFSIPVLATVILFTVFAIDWKQTEVFVRKIEPEIEYNFMIKNVVDISEMKSAEDSVKYQVAVNGMWFDPKVVTPEFMRTLILPGFRFNADLAYSGLKKMIDLHWYYLLYCVAIAILLGLSVFHLKSKIAFLKIAVFQLFTFALLYYLAYRALLAERHFFGFIVMSFLISLFYLKSDPRFQLDNVKSSASIAILIFTFAVMGFTAVNYKNKNDNAVKEARCYEEAMRDVEETYKGRIIVIPTGSFYLLDHPVTVRNRLYSNNTYLLYDTFNYSLYPRYIKYLSGLCGCVADNPVEFFKWLSEEGALYLADPQRFHLTQKYMSVVHGMDVQFLGTVGFEMPFCFENTRLKNLQIRSVTREN